MTEDTVTPSSGNVFADLDIPDAAHYMAKAELATRIFSIVKTRRLNHTSTGELLGITLPEVSALLKGRLDDFSTDQLLHFLNALGCDIQITVSSPHPDTLGQVHVTAR